MKKIIVFALIALPWPVYLFGVNVLDIPGPINYIATGNCALFDDIHDLCRDSLRREINVVGTVFAALMVACFLVGVGLLLQLVVKRVLRTRHTK